MAGSTIDELLVKIGVDTTQASKISDLINELVKLGNGAGKAADEIKKRMGEMGDKSTKSFDKVAKGADEAHKKTSKLKIGLVAIGAALALWGKRIASAFSGAIDNAANLFSKRGALFKITQSEISQAKQYKMAMDRTKLSIDSIATKIALNLAPSITKAANGFNEWLSANKLLISDGLTAVIKVFGGVIQLIVNGARAINLLITNTIGWKTAIIALAGALVYFNKKFLLSPFGLISAAIIGILLLVDDLMVYLDGGQSAFGDFLGACIDWIKKAVDWWNHLGKNWKSVIYAILGYIGLLVGKKGVASIATKVVKMSKSVIGAFGFIGKAVRTLTAIMIANPILAIITAIALAAYLIYDNWDTLKTFFSNFWDNVSNLFKDGIKNILMWFGMSEEGAEHTVNAISDFFGMIVDAIVAPFKAAWELVKSLFDIWTDDSKSITEKIGDSFGALFDFITKPFKMAIAWIKDNFEAYIDKVKNTLSSIGSWFGFGDDDEDIKNVPKSAITSSVTNQNKTANNNVQLNVNQSIVAPDPVSAGEYATNGLQKELQRATIATTGLSI